MTASILRHSRGHRDKMKANAHTLSSRFRNRVWATLPNERGVMTNFLDHVLRVVMKAGGSVPRVKLFLIADCYELQFTLPTHLNPEDIELPLTIRKVVRERVMR